MLVSITMSLEPVTLATAGTHGAIAQILRDFFVPVGPNRDEEWGQKISLCFLQLRRLVPVVPVVSLEQSLLYISRFCSP